MFFLLLHARTFFAIYTWMLLVAPESRWTVDAVTLFLCIYTVLWKRKDTARIHTASSFCNDVYRASVSVPAHNPYWPFFLSLPSERT